MLAHDGRMRADAVRNRARILDAARDLVAETGVDAPMDEVARRAGLAVGTLYRHFPAKDDLVAAVVADSVGRIAAMAEAALAEVDGGAPPGPVLDRLFRAVADGHATDRVFKAAAGRLEAPAAFTGQLAAAVPGGAESRAAEAITALLGRARAAGAVRADLDLTDLVLLLAGLPGVDVPVERRARYLDVVLAGLRPGGSVGSSA
jgi:AcrR family transcriptional regulator